MDERFIVPLQLDLGRLKSEAEKIAGRWNGEDDVFDGVSEEKAGLCNDIADAVDSLNELLAELTQIEL